MALQNQKRTEIESDSIIELARAKKLLCDQRDANERLVVVAMRAQDEAETSRASADELRSTAEFRERLIGIIGHDLRNPLNAVLMGAGLLLARGQLNDDDARVVGRIIGSGQRMKRLIRDVLEFTRARLGGGFSLRREIVDMHAVCKYVAEEQALAASAPVRWMTEGDVTGDWDFDLLTQALSNIVGNAVEHAARGTGVEIVARGERQDVVVAVMNEGAPIPAEVLRHIFDPFRQGASELPAKRAGNLGLGLYIASQVIFSHGGRLEARCSGGRTTFTMWVPRHTPTPAPAPGDSTSRIALDPST